MLIFVVAPTVVGSHMSLLRPATPRLPVDRRNGKPGEVSSSMFLHITSFADSSLDLRSLRNQRRSLTITGL